MPANITLNKQPVLGLLLLLFSNLLTAQWVVQNLPNSPAAVEIERFDSTWICWNNLQKIFRSDNFGGTWVIQSELPDTFYNNSTCRSGSVLYANLWRDSIWLSQDLGQNWQWLTETPDTATSGVSNGSDLLVNAQYLFAWNFLHENLWRFNLVNKTWHLSKKFRLAVNGYEFQPIEKDGKIWFHDKDGLWYSPDNGESWDLQIQGVIRGFAIRGDSVYVVTPDTAWRSFDGGGSWAAQPENTFDVFNKMKVLDNGRLFRFSNSSNTGFSVSDDWGMSWKILGKWYVYDLEQSGQLLLAPSNKGVLRSANGGDSWHLIPVDLPVANTLAALESWGGFLYLRESLLGFWSANGGASWLGNVDLEVQPALEWNGKVLGWGTALSPYRMVEMEPGNPFNWTPIPIEEAPLYFVSPLLESGDTLYCAGKDVFNVTHLYQSPDGGKNWTTKGNPNILSGLLETFKGKLYSLTNSYSIQFSSDGGLSWQPANNGLPPSTSGWILKRSANYLFAQSRQYNAPGDLYGSSDGGLNWMKIDAILDTAAYDKFDIKEFAVDHDNDILYAIGPHQKLYRTFGTSGQWQQIDIQDKFSISGYPKMIIQGGVLYIVPNGNSAGQVKFAYRDLSTLAKYHPRGLVYNDLNHNGQRDTLETEAPGVLIRAELAKSFTVSDSAGRFEYFTEYASDTLSVILNNPYVKVTPAKLLATDSDSTLSFGVFYPPDIVDLVISASVIGPFRPGFSGSWGVSVRNRGTVPVAGRLWAAMPSQLSNFSTLPLSTGQSTDTLFWDFNAIPTDSFLTWNVGGTLPAFTPLSEILKVTYWVETMAPDTLPSNNVISLQSQVVGSYDPNDKQALGEPYYSPAALVTGEPVVFTVRFRNTGSYPAAFIRILDTLQTVFDPATFEFLGASHPCTWGIKKTNILEFFFDEINLPFLEENEAASQGFVRFSVVPYPDVLRGEILKNRAHIFFDYNFPIQTNMVRLPVDNPDLLLYRDTMVCAGTLWAGVPVSENTIRYDSVLTPAADTIWMTAIMALPEYARTVDTVVVLGSTVLNTLIQADTVLVQSFLTENGCDSVIYWQVSILVPASEPARLRSHLECFPNPAGQFAEVRGCPPGGLLHLQHLSGSVVMELQVTTTEPVKLDLRTLPPGLYLVEYHLADRNWQAKLLHFDF